ncbi:MAG TPA: antibiotic biosynthesis monooxygenase family protein [Polyangiaceae bacterium]|nr:antibiotic biosynthesis monooxygenase family protein [Polyangiaceae bacterium]
MTSVTISAPAPVVTLIHVFTVDPDQQEAVVQALIRTTDEVMRHQPGFVSASIHKSLDGTKVANYAQWRDRADVDAMLQDHVAQRHLNEVAELSLGYEPSLYVVESVQAGGTSAE